VTTNDVLPLIVARRHDSANLKCFEASGHQGLNLDGFIVSTASVYTKTIKNIRSCFSASGIVLPSWKQSQN